MRSETKTTQTELINQLKKHIGPLPERSFVKCRLDGFVGEVLHLSHPEEKPLLSIIIPTIDADRGGTFPLLIRQLQQQTLWRKCELIVIKGDNRQGRAINIGAALSQAKYLLTLDDDTELKNEHTFENLLKAMEENTDIGMTGGINVIPKDAPPFIKRVMKEIPRRSTPHVDKITDSDMAEHPLLMMKKDVFIKVGGENELMPRGLDPYLRNEFRKAAYRVVIAPGATYSHLPPPTLFKLLKQFFRNGKQAAFCNKYYPQWVIETPDYHGEFVTKAPFWFRVMRYPIRMLSSLVQGKWIWFMCEIFYAVGFILGWLNDQVGVKTL